MNEAKYADKNIVKYFSKHLEEFRRDMHYYKEIVFSDMFTQYGAGLVSSDNNLYGGSSLPQINNNK